VLAVLVLTARFVPESRAPRARRFDPAGQLLVIVLLSGLTFGIIEDPVRGWASPVIVGSFLAAVAALVVLLRVESRAAGPPGRTDPSRPGDLAARTRRPGVGPSGAHAPRHHAERS
jgi:hypothetical protein